MKSDSSKKIIQMFRHTNASAITLKVSDKFDLIRGGRLSDLSIAYETWGSLNSDKSNVIVIFTGLSADWMERGSLCIDYLLSLFYVLMKGFKLDDSSNIKNVYTSLSDKIPINSSRAIAIIRVLYDFKIDVKGNLNKKFLYDNLLIVLNKELY